MHRLDNIIRPAEQLSSAVHRCLSMAIEHVIRQAKAHSLKGKQVGAKLLWDEGTDYSLILLRLLFRLASLMLLGLTVILTIGYTNEQRAVKTQEQESFFKA